MPTISAYSGQSKLSKQEIANEASARAAAITAAEGRAAATAQDKADAAQAAAISTAAADAKSKADAALEAAKTYTNTQVTSAQANAIAAASADATTKANAARDAAISAASSDAQDKADTAEQNAIAAIPSITHLISASTANANISAAEGRAAADAQSKADAALQDAKDFVNGLGLASDSGVSALTTRVETLESGLAEAVAEAVEQAAVDETVTSAIAALQAQDSQFTSDLATKVASSLHDDTVTKIDNFITAFLGAYELSKDGVAYASAADFLSGGGDAGAGSGGNSGPPVAPEPTIVHETNGEYPVPTSADDGGWYEVSAGLRESIMPYLGVTEPISSYTFMFGTAASLDNTGAAYGDNWFGYVTYYVGSSEYRRYVAVNRVAAPSVIDQINGEYPVPSAPSDMGWFDKSIESGTTLGGMVLGFSDSAEITGATKIGSSAASIETNGNIWYVGMNPDIWYGTIEYTLYGQSYRRYMRLNVESGGGGGF